MSMMSMSLPPHCPSERTVTSLAFQFMPAMPEPLLVFARMVPATWEPWNESGSPLPPQFPSPASL